MQVVAAFMLGVALTLGAAALYDSTRKPYERTLVNWDVVWDKRRS